jgi:hypothetical protein
MPKNHFANYHEANCRRACGHGDMSTPSFGCHLNPIPTKEKDFANHILMSPPSFESRHRRA